ncbi:hypothetical protein CKAH01_13784 [Colletotrichum kahawae]|uniref:Uncharacterized protein n=1 Tax=Colletotrichum kahawae TaxID=34407 RepID=A0AAD9YMA2_COLKA|nr:hypothetical protein CKAH01_13784 [Colletotrichum kahawae]
MAERMSKDFLNHNDPSYIQADLLDVIGAFNLAAGISTRSLGLDRKLRALTLHREKVSQLGTEALNRKESFIRFSNILNNVGCAYFDFGMFSDAAPLLAESLALKKHWSSVEELPYGFGEVYKNLAVISLAAEEPAEAKHKEVMRLAETKNLRQALRPSGMDLGSSRLDPETSRTESWPKECIARAKYWLSLALPAQRKTIEAEDFKHEAFQACSNLLPSSVTPEDSEEFFDQLVSFRGGRLTGRLKWPVLDKVV